MDLSKQVVYPDINNDSIYHGSMNIDGQIFEIKFSNPMHLHHESKNEGKSEDVRDSNIVCEMDGKLAQILFDCSSIVQNKLFQSTTPEQFINELYNMVYKAVQQQPRSKVPPSSFYHTICRELDNVGWSRIKQISSDMTQFVLIAHKKHELHFKITEPNKFPMTKPLIVATQLPLAFEYEWSCDINLSGSEPATDDEEDEDEDLVIMHDQTSSTNRKTTASKSQYTHIVNILKQYKRECSKYVLFWRVLDDFYKHCVVLQPTEKDYGCHTLRVLLDKESKTMMEITLDVLQCTARKCECKFYGMKQEVLRLEDTWNEADDAWDPQVYPTQNIEQILGITLISEHDMNGKNKAEYMEQMECSMCLEFHDEEENAIPSVVCKSCKNGFHKTCLLRWFSSLESVQRTYTCVNGKCPQCTDSLSVAL